MRTLWAWSVQARQQKAPQNASQLNSRQAHIARATNTRPSAACHRLLAVAIAGGVAACGAVGIQLAGRILAGRDVEGGVACRSGRPGQAGQPPAPDQPPPRGCPTACAAARSACRRSRVRGACWQPACTQQLPSRPPTCEEAKGLDVEARHLAGPAASSVMTAQVKRCAR